MNNEFEYSLENPVVIKCHICNGFQPLCNGIACSDCKYYDELFPKCSSVQLNEPECTCNDDELLINYHFKIIELQNIIDGMYLQYNLIMKSFNAKTLGGRNE